MTFLAVNGNFFNTGAKVQIICSSAKIILYKMAKTDNKHIIFHRFQGKTVSLH